MLSPHLHDGPAYQQKSSLGKGDRTPEMTTTLDIFSMTSRIIDRSYMNPPQVSRCPSGPFQLFVIGTELIINFHTTPLFSHPFSQSNKSFNCRSPSIVFSGPSTAKLLVLYRRVSRKKKLVSP